MKSRLYLPLLLFFLLQFSLVAQDRIYFADGTMESGKFISKTSRFIYFAVSNSNDTSKYYEHDVAMYLLENGKHKVINGHFNKYIGEERIAQELKDWKNTAKNKIKVNLLNFTLPKNLEVTYQRRLSRAIALELPVTLGYGWRDAELGNYIFEIRKRYAVGISALYFPSRAPDAPVEFYVGPYLEAGNVYFSDYYREHWTRLPHGINSSNYITYGVHMGVGFNLNKWLCLSIESSPGARQNLSHGVNWTPAINMNFNISAKF